jgi:uncharacterized protein
VTAQGRPAPPDQSGCAGAAPEPADERARFPTKALGIAVAGLVAGNLVAVIGYVVGQAALPGTNAGALLLSELALWGGMVGACAYASRVHATGSLRRDFAIRPRPVDVGIGLLAAIADLVAAYAVSFLVSLLGNDFVGSNSNIVTDVRDDTAALVLTIVFALAGAPIVEELFFRGLLQRSLEPLAGVAGAIVLQGLVFGGIHVLETTGAGRLGLWLSLSAVGVVHGVVYQRVKRLTASMWAHALFNTSGVVLIFAFVRPL